MAYLRRTHDKLEPLQAQFLTITSLIQAHMDHLWIGLQLLLPTVRLPFQLGEASFSHLGPKRSGE
jgi:hypothetical protein